MEIIRSGDEKIIRLTRKPDKDRVSSWRLSAWCVLYQDADKANEKNTCFLKNTLTRQLYVLSPEEYTAIKKCREQPVSWSDLAESGLESLMDSHCMIPADLDEYEEYISLLHILQIMRKPSSGYEGYTIFPTTGCNARCIYCFEYDYIPHTMTEETALATADFISRTKADQPIRLQWFGGEPLAAASRIDLICRELEKKAVDFRSSMITNGTLMTPDLADRAVKLWRLKKVQVSLDGDRLSYEARKRYVNPKQHHYDAAMEGIRLLDNRNVEIVLRCNYDGDNLGGLREFCRDIHSRTGSSPNIRLCFIPLYQEREKGTAPTLVNQVQEIEDYAESLGLRTQKMKSKDKLKTHFCMADDIERCVVIDPDGNLQHCEHLSDKNIFGNVIDGVTDKGKYEALQQQRGVEAECRHCPFLPECTPFAKKGCPVGVFESCRAVKQAKTENALHRIAVDRNLICSI